MGAKEWTWDERDSLRKAWNSGSEIQDICKALNRTPGSIKTQIAKIGLKPRNRRKGKSKDCKARMCLRCGQSFMSYNGLRLCGPCHESIELYGPMAEGF